MNTKNPILIAAVVGVLAAFGFYHFGLQPKRKEAATVKAKVTDARARLESARELLSSNENAKKSYRSDYATVVRLGKAVPGDDDVRSLVVQLDQTAKRTHIDFQSIEVGGGNASVAPTSIDPSAAGTAPLPPGATVGPAGFPVMPFSFSFRGGFFRLATFFSRLDAFVKANNDRVSVSGRLLTVDGVKLEPDSTGFPNIKATVTATSYLVSPLEGATGGADASGPDGAAATGADGTGEATTPVTTTATSTGVIR